MKQIKKDYSSSKHKSFVQHLYNVVPTSSTLTQHCTNIVQMFCVYWGGGGGVVLSGLMVDCIFLVQWVNIEFYPLKQAYVIISRIVGMKRLVRTHY